MTLTEFVNKYVGTKVDYDKKYGCQCVDLFRQYCQDVLDTPHTGAVEGAKDLYLNYSKLPMEEIYFKRTGIDCKFDIGDVLIYGSTPTNKYGHVCIMLGELLYTPYRFIVIEQNGLKQDGVKLSFRTDNNLLGALRFRGNFKV